MLRCTTLPIRRSATIRTSGFLLLLFAGHLPALHAGDDPRKVALLALELSSETHLAIYRQSALGERGQVLQALDDLESKAQAGTLVMADIGALAVVVATFQQRIRDHLETAITNIGFETMSIHADLTAAAVPYAEWPRGLHKGDGGLTDRIRAKAEDFTKSFIEGMEKKIQKTGKRLLKYAGTSLTARLEPPLSVVDWAVSLGGGTAVSTNTATILEIDMVLAASELGAANDGRIYVAGSASFFDGAVTVRVLNPGGGATSQNLTPAQLTHRFIATFSSIQEGQFLVDARHGLLATRVTRTISVR